MVTYDGTHFTEIKDKGLVSDVFGEKEMQKMASAGRIGIGHVRYPTAGGVLASDAQPFFVNSPLGIYLVHNGNLTNADELREILRGTDSFFNRHLRTSSDSEVLLNVLADAIHRQHQKCVLNDCCDPETNIQRLVIDAVKECMSVLKGAYSVVAIIDGVGLLAFRDPYGVRPLCIGRRAPVDSDKGWEYAVASEDCTFGPLEMTHLRDVAPGECVIIDQEGNITSEQVSEKSELKPCVFEYIYLARPDSVLNDISVYEYQLAMGTRLARKIQETKWPIDVVVPVPDGSRPACIQISAELGLPYREGLVKNRYIGRTFIMPDQKTRSSSVRRKLNAMSAVFEGKNVLLVDDSIVRGTTMSQIVNMVRKAGAKRVYLASASPPVKHANVYGVDMPSKRELVMANLTEEELCERLGADGIIFQTVDDLLEAGRELNPNIVDFEASCFTGHYLPDVDAEYLEAQEVSDRASRSEAVIT